MCWCCRKKESKKDKKTLMQRLQQSILSLSVVLGLILFSIIMIVYGTVKSYQFLLDPANLSAAKTACNYLMWFVIGAFTFSTLMILYYFRAKRVVVTINNTCFILGAVILLLLSFKIMEWQEDAKQEILDDFSQSCLEIQHDAEFINLSKADLLEQGVFSRLNKINVAASDILCTENCPC